MPRALTASEAAFVRINARMAAWSSLAYYYFEDETAATAAKPSAVSAFRDRPATAPRDVAALPSGPTISGSRIFASRL